jgi:DNA-binding NtrC family response regulator
MIYNYDIMLYHRKGPMKIAFGIICGEYNQDENLEKSGREYYSPSFRLAMLPLADADGELTKPHYDKVVFGLGGKNAKYSNLLKEMVADRGVKMQFVEFDQHDVHDYDAAHYMLWNNIDRIIKNDNPEIVYLHIDSGTFVQQMQLYRYADRQMFSCPVRLLTTSIDESTSKIKYRIPRLGLFRRSAPCKNQDPNLLQSFINKFGTASEVFEKELLSLLVQVGVNTSDPILLTGETGTGKTYLANHIHDTWFKQNHPNDKHGDTKYHEVNCAGMDPTFLYSEIFGHLKGAYTGASQEKKGKLALAEGGTLFLDEIGDLQPYAQSMLLKAIDEKEYFPLGATKPKKVECRFILATNRDLINDIVNNRFREDLYERIRYWEFRLPSLRERGDLPELIRKELNLWFENNKKKEYRQGLDFSDAAFIEFMKLIENNVGALTGNFRALKRIIWRMATLTVLNQEPEISIETVKYVLSLERRALLTKGNELSADSFVEAAKLKYPGFPRNKAIEKYLIDYSIDRFKTKSDAGIWLYQAEGQRLSNPSDKISTRQRILQERNAKQAH